MADIQQTRRMIRKHLNLDTGNGVLGDASGTIYVLNRPGYVYVRERQAGGALSYRKEIKLGPNINLQMKPGMPVTLGYDHNRERCVLSVDDKALIAAGGNPLQFNPLDPSMQYSRQDAIVTASCVPNGAMTVKTSGWYFVRNRRVYRFGGKKDDLNGYIPASGLHRLVGVFILADGTGTELKASTAQSQLAPLDETDAQECIDASSTGSTPIHYWIVRYGHTTIVKDDTYIDGRNIINVGAGDSQRAIRVVTAAGAVTVSKSDDVVVVNKSSGAATAVNLPSSPATGLAFTIKDGKGDAASNNITITPAAGNIDGSGAYVINTNYGKATVIYNGSGWSVIG